jgi:hypothetical protein
MNLVYGWCVKYMDPEKREEWQAMLEAPLPGQERAKPTPFTAAQEGADFMAAMAAHQTRQPA